MLGPERFASFETPNVIDPGDDAPIQPPRRGRPEEPRQTTGESTGVPLYRSSTRAPGLGRTEKIDLGDYQQARKSSKRLINSIDDLDILEQQRDDDEDDENHHSLPSIDEARNYASALLQDANRRTSSSNRDLGSEEPTNAPGGLLSPLSYATATATTTMSHDGSKHLVRNQVLPLVAKVSGAVLILVLLIVAVSRL